MRFLLYILEQLLEHGRMLAVIPVLSPEWSLTFTVRLLDLSALSGEYSGIIHLTENGNGGPYGDRTPLVNLKKVSEAFHLELASAINSQDKFWLSAHVMKVGESTHVEIHQRYVSGGNYRFFVKINGQEVYSIINRDARQFYNVKVYASDPWHPVSPGYIKNLEVTNFL